VKRTPTCRFTCSEAFDQDRRPQYEHGVVWQALGEIAVARNLSIPALVTAIDTERKHDNLSSVIRLFVLDYYRRLAEGKAKR
jgi:predicted DNA-binding ribbon-helix-helix protein